MGPIAAFTLVKSFGVEGIGLKSRISYQISLFSIFLNEFDIVEYQSIKLNFPNMNLKSKSQNKVGYKSASNFPRPNTTLLSGEGKDFLSRCLYTYANDGTCTENIVLS